MGGRGPDTKPPDGDRGSSLIELWKGDVLLYPDTVWSKMGEASMKDPIQEQKRLPSVKMRLESVARSQGVLVAPDRSEFICRTISSLNKM
jgi:hypothetical protein